MEKQVVFFGAGASFGAREEPRPPLGKELHQWVLQYLTIKDEIDRDILKNEWGLETVQSLKNR